VTGATQPRVSLVVPVRNEETHIGSCIESISRQTYPRRYIEVIVVDGDSSDATLEIVRRGLDGLPRCQILHNRHGDLPHGLNIGIGAASGQYIGYVHGHSILPDDYVERVVRVLDERDAWSVGGRIVRRTRGPMHRAIAIATSSPIGVGDSTHNYAAEPGWVETVFPGFWRREVFDRIGTFDPAMVANEDNEFSYRIRQAGGGIWYDPEIAVEYVPRATLGGLFHQYRRYALGKMRVLRKHRGGIRPRHLVPAAWVAAVVIGAGGAALWPALATPWIAAIALYLLVIGIAAVRLSQPGVGWWRILAALATLHVAYGIGTWQGVLTWRG